MPWNLTAHTALASHPEHFNSTAQLASLNSFLSPPKESLIYGRPLASSSSYDCDSLAGDAEEVETVGSGYGSTSSVRAGTDDNRNNIPPKDIYIRQPRVDTGSPPTVPRMNIYGKYICDYPKCDDFEASRRCERKKHVDKHYRPHRCQEPACAASKGFTSSGGLLRHEREVHNKHGGPKVQFACTYPDCKRKNKFFTRKENLNGHLRRVHHHTEKLDDTQESISDDKVQVDEAGTRASRCPEPDAENEDFTMLLHDPKHYLLGHDLNGRSEAEPLAAKIRLCR